MFHGLKVAVSGKSSITPYITTTSINLPSTLAFPFLPWFLACQEGLVALMVPVYPVDLSSRDPPSLLWLWCILHPWQEWSSVLAGPFRLFPPSCQEGLMDLGSLPLPVHPFHLLIPGIGRPNWQCSTVNVTPYAFGVICHRTNFNCSLCSEHSYQENIWTQQWCEMEDGENCTVRPLPSLFQRRLDNACSTLPKHSSDVCDMTVLSFSNNTPGWW